MVEGVKDLPAELEVPAFGQMQVLGEREVRVPEARHATRRGTKPNVSVAPPDVERIEVEFQTCRRVNTCSCNLNDRWVRSERSFESRGIEPLVFDLLAALARTAARGIPD